MSWKRTICYICGGVAEKFIYGRDLRIRCDNCETFYFLNSEVQKFNLENNLLVCENPETHEKAPLSKTQKDKLLDHVKKHRDPNGKNPVEITPELINSL